MGVPSTLFLVNQFLSACRQHSCASCTSVSRQFFPVCSLLSFHIRCESLLSQVMTHCLPGRYVIPHTNSISSAHPKRMFEQPNFNSSTHASLNLTSMFWSGLIPVRFSHLHILTPNLKDFAPATTQC
ncbi:hypothetical protein P692DRAFT_20278357 [Suillus brevipes Sb2]|nr:hypothetical protein P692DRAFT_20278357 [Suillus brevipes Sb2]